MNMEPAAAIMLYPTISEVMSGPMAEVSVTISLDVPVWN